MFAGQCITELCPGSETSSLPQTDVMTVGWEHMMGVGSGGGGFLLPGGGSVFVKRCVRVCWVSKGALSVAGTVSVHGESGFHPG